MFNFNVFRESFFAEKSQIENMFFKINFIVKINNE